VPVSLLSARPSPSTRPVPAYRDAAIKALSEKLDDARERRNRLRENGLATDGLDCEILDLRRQLREGGQLLAGDALDDGRYLLVKPVGRGGFSVVWEAYDRRKDQRVALKVLHSHLAGDPLRRERFFRGARAMMKLAGPAVVQVLEPEQEDAGFYYFVMEFVPGGNLSEAVLEGRLEKESVCPLMLRVCEAVAAAHNEGMIHRDIKPSNILLDAEGNPKLTDFDLVGARDTTGGTRTGALGTFLYAAPECLDRPQEATPRADVYGLGMTTIFCLSGQELTRSIVRTSAPVISGLRCSSQLKAVLARAVAWEPGERFADAGVLMRALRDALAGPLPAFPRPSPQTVVPPPSHVASIVLDPELAEPASAELVPTPTPGSRRRERTTPILPRFPLPQWIVGAVGATSVIALIWYLVFSPSGGDSRVDSPSRVAAPNPPDARPVDAVSRAALEGLPDAQPPSGGATAGGCPAGMVRVPAGTFRMGSPAGVGDEDEHPQHKVALSAYCIDRTEVTVKAYAACVAAKAKGCSAPPLTVHWSEYSAADVKRYSRFCNRDDRPDHPINCVDWNQAAAYCTWEGKRLPTEAEWEYAARGNDNRVYPWGNEAPSAKRLNVCGSECVAMAKRELNQDWGKMYDASDGYETTAPVGSFSGGASPFGALDMAGNVWEWTADWYGAYSGAAVTDPRGAKMGTARVIRGSAWNFNDAANVRAANRYLNGPSDRVDDVGFRCARGD
jgi:formylglycine-generating enzyme required for sulfatase activity